MGSGGLNGVSSRSGYGVRSSAPWALGGDEATESEQKDEFHSGRSGSSDEPAAPQFLVEADDLYDEGYGGSRLVAPPVLGEAPQGYRDF